MATKFGMGDEVVDPYTCAKFYHYPIRGFRSTPPPLPARSDAYKMTRLVNILGVLLSYSQDPCTEFYDQYVKCRFAQGCAFWGTRKQNFTFRPHFPLKTQIFGQFLTGFQKISRQKGLNSGDAHL